MAYLANLAIGKSSARTLAVLLLFIIGSSSLCAQIFPRIEKEDVKRRIASGSTEPEVKATPDEEPESKDVVVDGEKALKRYNELLDSYQKDERAQKKAMSKHVDEFHISVRDYFEGTYLLRLGMYKDAERKLKDVGISVRHENEIKTDELKKIAADIKKGGAYLYRMIAVVMQQWDDFKDEDAATAAWKDASKDAIEVRAELEKLIKDGKATSDSDIVNVMTAWLLTAKRQWLQTWKYEKNLKEHPESQFTWQFFIGAMGSRLNNMKDEYTPNYLKQRAALQVMKEFFPHTPYVTAGTCDMTLAVNYIATGQFDNVDACLEPQEYHSILGRVALQKGRDGVETYRKLLEAYKNK